MADYVTVAGTDDVSPGEMLRAIVNDVAVCLYNVDGEFCATQDTCTHAEASLAEGELDGEVVTCPLHGAAFNCRTGAVLSFPATFPLTSYPVRVEGGQVQVLVER